MAGESEDYGSARITLDLDEDGAVRDAAAVGADLERALTRATRNIGRGIVRNLRNSLRAATLQVQVAADTARLERQLRTEVRQLAAVALPVDADMARFERQLRTSVRDLAAVVVPVTADVRQLQQAVQNAGGASIQATVTPNVRGFARQLRRALRGVTAEIRVRADARRLVREIEAALRDVDPPRLRVQVEADLSEIRSQLASLQPPRIEVRIALDTDAVRQQLDELANQTLNIPVTVGGDGGAAAAGGTAGAAALGGLTGALRAAGPWGAVIGAVAAYAGLIGKTLMAGIQGVIEHEQLTGSLRAALGLSTSEANDVGRVVGQLYARGVVESVEEGTTAVQAALRAGLAAPEDLPGLESIASSVADLGRLMEEDVGKVARAVGQMVRTGLVDNAAQGVDLLTKSVQQGGNIAEDLLDTFTEYPTQFRQLGLSAEEAFGLIQQGLAAGARDSDVIADALKEFSIEAAQGGKRVTDAFKDANLDAERLTDAFAKGGPSARKALDEVFDKLQSIKDPLERNQVAVGLFGTKAEDLAGALGALDLDTATKEMDGFGGAAKRAGDDLRDNLGTRLTRIGREAKQAFEALFTGDFSQFGDVKDAIQDALPSLKEAGAHIAHAIEDGIAEYGPKIFQAVYRLAFELGERVDIWGPLLLKILAGAASLPSIVGSLILTAIAGALAGLGSKLLPYLETAWDAVADFFTETVPRWGSEVGSMISDALGSAWQGAKDAARSGADSVIGFITGLPGRIASEAGSLATSISTAMGEAWEGAKQKASEGVTATVDFVRQLPGRIWDALLGLGPLLVDAFTTAVANLIIGLLTLLAGVVFVFTELPGRIWNALLDLGRVLVDAFQSGFTSAKTALTTWAVETLDYLQGLPGRVYTALLQFGTNLVRSLVTGYTQAKARTIAWAVDLLNYLRGLPGRVYGALAQFGSNVVRAVVTGYNQAKARTTQWVSQTVASARQLPGRVYSALSNLASRIGSAFSSAYARAKTVVGQLIGGVVSLFREMPGRILSAIGNIGSQIVQKVKSGIPSSVRKYLPFAKGGIVYGPTHALIGEAGPEVVIPLTNPKRAVQLVQQSGLLGILAGQNRALAATATAATSTSAVSVTGAVSTLRSLLAGVGQLLDGVGANVVQGMVEGIRAGAGQVADAASDMADTAAVAARDTLEIHSPSKVFAKIGRDVGRGFVEGLTGTAAQIKSTTEKLVKAIQSAFEGKKSRVDDRLVAMLDSGNKRLTKLAAQRDALAKRIADAQKFAADTAQQALQAFSLQSLTQGSEEVTAKGLASGLEDALKQVKTFSANLNNLAKRGLSKALLEQIVSLGPVQGAQIAAALAGSTKDSLKRLNTLQTDLTRASTKLGNTSADVLFDAGAQAGKGFLAGLKGQRKAIERLMLDIAKGMQAAIRSALRIKSPSRVTWRLGTYTGLGLQLGLMDSIAGIMRAATTAARSVVDAVGGQFDLLPGRVSSSLAGVGGMSADVIPLTRTQRVLQAGAPGPGAQGGGARQVVQNNHFEIREVGNAHVTAQRVVNRLVYAAGM
ncbi:phage tail tape measure protein [Streptomyces sp. KAU_LT]|uniref:phage tail tape measure protein n=1 Tax=Streptomyces sp. KAU_LT TaxID=3046669 RepID=UPI0024B6950C|nr:phage tail tape measure protein [Streptomyces sp. KAU_LT]MDI9829681.1 phage tail tape measure protein [Streptomyces sp. KAU_LT]